MQSQNKFFDDFAKIINGAAGTLAGVGREAEASARERAKEWFGGADFVSREEFDAVKDMAAKARAEVDALKKRLDALEGKPDKTAAKPAARKAATKSATRKPSAKRTSPKAGPKTGGKPAA